MVNFIPETVTPSVKSVPYFEDSKDAKVPGRSTTKSDSVLQKEIRNLMMQLDAGNIVFSPGKFEVTVGQKPRHGWLMTFSINGLKGRMEIAALPIHYETPLKKAAALRQALYLVRNWLESEVFSVMYRPGAVPLIPFLIAAGGKTITEVMIESTEIPLLASG